MKCLAHVNEKKPTSLDEGGPWSREELSSLFAVRLDSEKHISFPLLIDAQQKISRVS